MLDQILDTEDDSVSSILGQIADFVCDWEGPVAEQLDLTSAEVAAVKTEYPKFSVCKRKHYTTTRI